MREVAVNAQWQGGADMVTYYGAYELLDLYLTGQNVTLLPVSVEKSNALEKTNGILGFEILHRQMQESFRIMSRSAPDKIVTLGGGCDADVPGIVYLSEKCHGDLTVLWLDAHGDLNTPEESSSSLFYGMPLRSLMDGSCFGLLENRFPLKAVQIIHIGGREFDAAEERFINTSGIRAYTVQDIRAGRISVENLANHVYVHLDLDVLDPSDFPYTPLPVANGLYSEEVFWILEHFKDKLVGLGIYEYKPCHRKIPCIEKLIQFGLGI